MNRTNTPRDDGNARRTRCASILNDVLGPIMRGPSSSHTAGSFRIGALTRQLLGETAQHTDITVDPAGSLAPTLEQLGVDTAFVSGAMGWSLLDSDYTSTLQRARALGAQFDFRIEPLNHSDHPNAMWIEARTSSGDALRVGAESIGGGSIRITQMDDWPVQVDGESFEVLIEATPQAAAECESILAADPAEVAVRRRARQDCVLLHASCTGNLDPDSRAMLSHTAGVFLVRCCEPFGRMKSGEGLFESASDLVALAQSQSISLGQAALAHESALLDMSSDDVMVEIAERLEIMDNSIRTGLDDGSADMMLLDPTARGILSADTDGRLAIGGLPTRAAARAMAVMHACNSRCVVCAAPTGGSAGVIPGVVYTLIEERHVDREAAALSLLAAGAVGAVVANRATFAAETAGCQVEIGAAGAMAAAAVVEIAGGSARQACDAAAISLQNTMGSVCDPVHGTCEIPCHTRNAVAASSAIVCADLIIGGYANPVPLDESIDASYAVGKVLPSELRCTAAGGIAVTPSALSLRRKR